MDILMWEKQKRDLCAFLQERVIGNQSQILYADLIKKPLPGFLKSYLKRQVRKLLESENPLQIKASARYDLEDPRIKSLLSSLNTALMEVTVFSREAIIEMIEKTVAFELDFLGKPRQTLSQVFYKHKEKRSRAEILEALIGMSDDRPYMRHLIQVIRNLDSNEISKEDFSKIALETEEEVYRQKPISAFVQDISALLHFFRMVRGEACSVVHKDLVITMLRERNLTGLAERFQSELGENEETLELNEIETILERQLLLQNLEPVETGSESERETENQSHPSTTEELRPVEKATLELDEEEGLRGWILGTKTRTQVLSPKKVPPLKKKEAVVIEPIRNRIQEPTLDDNGSKTIIDRALIESQPQGPFPSLRPLIDERSKKMLIKGLFRKDEQAFHDLVHKLEGVGTWKEAKKIIDEELTRRGVEPFSREAIRLSDLVFSRYFPKR
ncbi:MAG: hypothetical protein ONB05_05140 [candidate division KSB1 bacterium]|nr:hypothetical protein [candidate division KSB1 bacterium]